MPNLKLLREQQNLTQEELSEKSGISVRTIQRIE
ncbi:helix-turn-helix transcriptional regulator, partial [Flavobacterium lindanitolerans]